MNSGKGGRPETMTKRDVELVRDLNASGSPLYFIADVVYGISYDTLRQRLKGWRKRNDK